MISSLKERNSYNKTVSFDQDLIDSLKKEPDELTTWNIIKQIQFLSDNKLRSGVFEVELYKRSNQTNNTYGDDFIGNAFRF